MGNYKYRSIDNVDGKTKKPKKFIVDCFSNELETIKNDDVRNFAIETLRMAPGYFFTAPSSSTGKHHPSYEFSTGGLILHTKAVVYFVKQLKELEDFSFSERESDLLIVAALLHDCKKNGNNPQSKNTNFEHPRLAANMVRKCVGCGIITDEEVMFVAETIESHMGQWNTNGKNSKYDPLPKPITQAQKVLHISDYLASREDIDLRKYLNIEKIDYSMFTIHIGRYKGKTIYEIADFDTNYLTWIYNVEQENIKQGRRLMTNRYIVSALKSILFDDSPTAASIDLNDYSEEKQISLFK